MDINRETPELEQTTDALHEQRQWLQVTLSSIGDGVITTDAEGNVTFLNPVAQSLTGWSQDEAAGLPLDTVFKIVNEETRRTVANPADVDVAYSGQTALSAVDEYQPNIVLLDIGLPEMDGYEIARRLRQQLKDVWLIALTGYGQDSDRQQSKEAGFDHHLVKPVDPQKLEELLARLIKLSRSAKAN